MLRKTCPASDILFETTSDSPDLAGFIGQDRAVQSVRFGVGIRRKGYNLFAIGPSGVGKQTLLRMILAEENTERKTPPDWCYVHNFGNPHRPRALELPPGTGARLAADMEWAIAELRVALRSAFESQEYRSRKGEVENRFKEMEDRAFSEIQEDAKRRNVGILRTDAGLVLGPTRNDGIMDAAEFQGLPEEERARWRTAMENLSERLQELHRKSHEWGRQRLQELKSLDRETAVSAARRVMDCVRKNHGGIPAILEYLSQVEIDVVESTDEFLEPAQEGLAAALGKALKSGQEDGGQALRRYRINVLVDHGDRGGAPIVQEENPTLANIIGRIEHESQFGNLVTHFTLIKAGAMHRAAGGYLLLDAMKVLRNPFAWEALKRAIRTEEIRMESLGEAVGLVPTLTLEPEPIPLRDTKIILFGERLLYYLLADLDSDFPELFKVLVDFDEGMERSPESHARYANLIATLVRREGLRPFHRDAVAGVIDHASRRAGDAEKLSANMRELVDLLREADYWAGKAGRSVAAPEDVQDAIHAQIHRSNRLHERLLEAVRRGHVHIDTTGGKIGQVNGISVLELGGYPFGHPSRITARVRMGKGELVDIEREVKLGGPLHSKGVLILSGFLGTRYARQAPLSLSATLVFEQSYSSVEGDSASLAELCALLSALAERPIRQGLAVTGSVDQHGRVQAIGAVNEKIEGFFDVCRECGPAGDQGVLIPVSNAGNLMVRRDVVEAAEAGLFRIFAVEDVDGAMELLTGLPAGVRDGSGQFPKGSVNALVEARLLAFSESARAYWRGAMPPGSSGSPS